MNNLRDIVGAEVKEKKNILRNSSDEKGKALLLNTNEEYKTNNL